MDKVDGDKIATTTVDKTPSVKNGVATVSITEKALTDALKENNNAAKDGKADGQVIAIDVSTKKAADTTEVTLPSDALDKIADDNVSVKLVTGQGEIVLNDKALAQLVKDAGDDVVLNLTTGENGSVTLTAADSDSLGRGTASVTVAYDLPKDASKEDVRVYLLPNGDIAQAVELTDVEATKTEVTFETEVLGEFLITTEELAPARPEVKFDDVPADSWSAPYISDLASRGILTGDGKGNFQPKANVTREQFVKLLAGVAGAQPTETTMGFADVPESSWSAPYVSWAASMGLTSGTGDGKFTPAASMTRQDMCVMIYRYLNISGKTLTPENAPITFTDANEAAPWAQTAISMMQQAGILNGFETENGFAFRPTATATREECAKMLSILLEKLS